MDSIQLLGQASRWGGLAILFGGVIPLAAAWFLLWRKRGTETVVAYRATTVPFSDAETRFLDALDDAVGSDHRVFVKMRVADLLSVGQVDGRAAWQRAFNRISAKHVGFVVCRRDTLDVVAAVELDDRSHDSIARQQRDAFLDAAFSSAGVRLVRAPVRSQYDAAVVGATVLGDVSVARDGALDRVHAVADDPAGRRCHVCGSPMELRRSTRGVAGVQEYLVCTNTPRCRVRVAVRGSAPPVA